MWISFDLKIDIEPSGQYTTGLNQHINDLVIDNSHQYILGRISIQGACNSREYRGIEL